MKNADDIDLRQGCHDILIENITGFTEDDSVALTALNGRMERAFAAKVLRLDLCDVDIGKLAYLAESERIFVLCVIATNMLNIFIIY